MGVLKDSARGQPGRQERRLPVGRAGVEGGWQPPGSRNRQSVGREGKRGILWGFKTSHSL